MTGAILADDLTGACDAAARAAAAGWRVTVELAATDPAADVAAISTASRHLTGRKAAATAAAAAEKLVARSPAVFYKKIDSTLRGPWQEEVRAVAQAIGAARVVVCPAFPACGRVVRGSRVFTEGEAGPEIALDGALILDAESEDDLAHMARTFAGEGTLWVGSGGLARHVFGERRQPALPLPGAGRWMIVAGSNHPRTGEQMEWLKPRLDARDRLLDLNQAAKACAPGTGFFVAGGDTALRLLTRLGVGAIEIAGKAEPGVPAGKLRGGRADGLTLVTKAGGFGERETIARVLERLRT